MSQEIEPPAPDSTITVLLEIGRAFGRVPNLFQAYAKYPPLLEANWNKVKAVLLNGKLRRKAKETAALLVSNDNGCAYCVAAHSAALTSLGTSEAEIAAMLQSGTLPGLSEAEIALVNFARKVNLHWRDINEADFKALNALGVEEEEIVEILGVVELFAGFNRFARAMRIAVDF
ncbi:MAG TPA: peroxidase-related enzyme [Novimethylophilus sp.]|jgi:uncharacterized peroxidase-related enzyme|uniref:carboxymuconolactone decarboxylase family protein n=1 Tax=Novimethylophilus sp. TaxID=2137426 RepID=UPI002F3F0229